MSHFNLNHFKTTNPDVLGAGCNLDKVRFSDLNYSSRLAALLEATKGRGKAINTSDRFNDLLNGRMSLGAVIEATK